MTADPDYPLLFVAAYPREAEPWVSRWENPRALKLPVHWARAGKWRGRDVIAVANGVGTKRAIAAVESTQTREHNVVGVCCIGTGGALDPALAIADVVVATAVTNGRTSWPALDPKGLAARSGIVYSSRHIARTSEKKRNLHQSGAIIVEMESAGVAGIAQELRLPFYCIRAVSDLADETFFTDFESFLTSDGRFSEIRLATHALAHPIRGLGELLRLQRRTSLAAERLAEYLDTCNF